MWLNACPLHALINMKHNLVNALRGRVSGEVLDILDRLMNRFAPQRRESKPNLDLREHLETSYIDQNGDPEILSKFLKGFGHNLDACKLAHESILGRNDVDRRLLHPDLWSADNICHGLKHMDFITEWTMVDIYGSDLCKRLPMRLARNISLLFQTLNDWLAWTQEVILNRVFHGTIDDLEKSEHKFQRENQFEDSANLYQEFHSWAIQSCTEAMTTHIPQLETDVTKLLVYERMNFFIWPTQVHVKKYEAWNAVALSLKAGLDSALSIYVMLLFKIASEIPWNEDGSMSEEQRKIWLKSIQKFAIPWAKNSHAWAGNFFHTTKTRNNSGLSIGQNTLDAFQITGKESEQFVTIQPEMEAVLRLQMINLWMRRNWCPALKSSWWNAPAIFRLGELIRKWFDENKIQGIKSATKKP